MCILYALFSCISSIFLLTFIRSLNIHMYVCMINSHTLLIVLQISYIGFFIHMCHTSIDMYVLEYMYILIYVSFYMTICHMFIKSYDIHQLTKMYHTYLMFKWMSRIICQYIICLIHHIDMVSIIRFIAFIIWQICVIHAYDNYIVRSHCYICEVTIDICQR